MVKRTLIMQTGTSETINLMPNIFVRLTGALSIVQKLSPSTLIIGYTNRNAIEAMRNEPKTRRTRYDAVKYAGSVVANWRREMLMRYVPTRSAIMPECIH